MSGVEAAIAVAIFVVPAAAVWYLWRMMSDPARTDTDACEECGYDLRGSPARCPECGTVNERHARFRNLERLRNDWPTDILAPREPAYGEQPVVVYEHDERPIVDLLCEHLEARGVAAWAEDAPRINNVGADHGLALGTHKAVVWSGDEARARAIIVDLLNVEIVTG